MGSVTIHLLDEESSGLMSLINGSVKMELVENRDPLLDTDACCWDRFSMDVSVKNTPISPLPDRSISSKPGFSGNCGD